MNKHIKRLQVISGVIAVSSLVTWLSGHASDDKTMIVFGVVGSAISELFATIALGFQLKENVTFASSPIFGPILMVIAMIFGLFAYNSIGVLQTVWASIGIGFVGIALPIFE